MNTKHLAKKVGNSLQEDVAGVGAWAVGCHFQLIDSASIVCPSSRYDDSAGSSKMYETPFSITATPSI